MFELANTEIEEAYNKINSKRKRLGEYRKCIFHLHTPASYDYKYFGETEPCDINRLIAECNSKIPFAKDWTENDLDGFKEIKKYKSKEEFLAYLLIAYKLIISKIEMVVVADHHTFDGYIKLQEIIDSILKTWKPEDSIHPAVIPGIEVTCADRNHVVGIFNSRSYRSFDAELEKIIMNNELGTYETSIQVIDRVKKCTGISYLAHINSSDMFNPKHSYSYAFKKALLDSEKLDAIGVHFSDQIGIAEANIKKVTEREFCFVIDEDSHMFDDVATSPIWVKGSKIGYEMIRCAIRDYTISLEYNRPIEPKTYIKGMFIRANDDGFMRTTKSRDTIIPLSSELNCFIGGRGTGKSTILNMVGFILSQKIGNMLEEFCRYEAIWLLISVCSR